MSKYTQPLQPGVYYHIFNRGVNGEKIFLEERNFGYFLNLYVKHINPIANTYAYCLLSNHFHFLIKINSNSRPKEVQNILKPSQAFSNLFNAYTKSINKAYERTGPLFERPFKRVAITNSNYFSRLLIYVHQNPERHGFVDDFRLWPYSSFDVLTNDKNTFIQKDEVSEWFGDIKILINLHGIGVDENSLHDFICDD